MLGRLVPLGNETWKLLLQIADIVEVVTAPSVNKGLCVFLADLTETFLTTYFNLYHDENMKPKFHYLIHYPQQMLEFGPLVHCWTLRFEGKHMYFKELSNRIKNRKNICKTLAIRHEYYQSWCRRKENLLSSNGIEHSFGTMLPLRLMAHKIQEALMPITGGSENVYTAKKVGCNGTSYWQGCAVILGSDELLIFGIVSLICLLGGRVYFVCQEMNTVRYCTHLHSYIIKEKINFLAKKKMISLITTHSVSIPQQIMKNLSL